MRHEVKVQVGNKTISIETGVLAKQAAGAVMVRCGDTMVLVSACAEKTPRNEKVDFVPLMVEYKEKAYASGRIPGGFFKREARPGEQEILISRMIDRSIRPQFKKTHKRETQVIATVVSYDGVNSPDVLAMLGASAALHISELPFQNALAAVRVGYIDGNFIINPVNEEKEISELDILVAGTAEGIVMVEAGASELEESIIIDALMTGHAEIKKLVQAQEDMRQAVGKEKEIPEDYLYDEEFVSAIRNDISDSLRAAILEKEKHPRDAAIKAVKDAAKEKFVTEETSEKNAQDFGAVFEKIVSELCRSMILEEGLRSDGRRTDEIRPISIDLDVLPMVHGSSVFTRGETQALVALTLGVGTDEQMIDNLDGKSFRRFMLHYNFPPFCVGEVKMNLSTGRREIGHGALASRAVEAILPDYEEFPYTLRLVSEILESNGSSSMATVCGSSLALMQGGVNIKDHVAGIAMGLISDGEKYKILSDIQGLEDHEGDMDFKVCGTRSGITALQMDIKIPSVSRRQLEEALAQARDGRLHILGIMEKAITSPSDDVHARAPRISTIRVSKDKIRDIIGSGGKTIRGIIEETGAQIDINDDGVVNISSSDMEASERAIAIINDICREPEVGEVYDGIVKKIVDFGAFVEIMKGKEGLLHISELAHRRVENVTDILKEGDTVRVKLLGLDRGRMKLSRKALLERD